MTPLPSKDFEEERKPERADWSTKRGADEGDLLKKSSSPAARPESSDPDYLDPEEHDISEKGTGKPDVDATHPRDIGPMEGTMGGDSI